MKWLKIWDKVKAKGKDRVVFPMEDKDKVDINQDQVGKALVVGKEVTVEVKEVTVEVKEVKEVMFPHQTKVATHHKLPIKAHTNHNNK